MSVTNPVDVTTRHRYPDVFGLLPLTGGAQEEGDLAVPDDHAAFMDRDLSEVDFVYVWADGIHLRADQRGRIGRLPHRSVVHRRHRTPDHDRRSAPHPRGPPGEEAHHGRGLPHRSGDPPRQRGQEGEAGAGPRGADLRCCQTTAPVDTVVPTMAPPRSNSPAKVSASATIILPAKRAPRRFSAQLPCGRDEPSRPPGMRQILGNGTSPTPIVRE